MGHRPSRRTIAAFVFAVMGAVIAWLVLGGRERTVRLADGREFSVVAVTYGTRHVLDEGPPWAKLIARGSRSMAYRFGYRTSGTYTSAVPSVLVWTRWSPQNTNVPPRFASVADSTGTETEPDFACISGPMGMGKGGTLVGWRFENYPRFHNAFRLRFYEYDLFHVRARGDGEVIVRNPVPARSPPSPAPAPPSRITNGALEITLARLLCDGPPPRRPLAAKSAITPWNLAEFEFRENGRSTTDWTVKRIEAFGATGNHFVAEGLAVELEEGRRVARFAGAFWRDEADWRVVAEVTPTLNFPAEGLWQIRLPGAAFSRGSFSTNLQSVAPGLRHFRLFVETKGADPGGLSPGPRVASLRADFTPGAIDQYVDVAGAVDDLGRKLRVVSSFLPRSGTCEADLQLPGETQFVDVTFAIHRSLRAEFRVRPEFVSAKAP